MAQKFLSVKNFEKYQHFKKAMPPWIKLYRSMYGDRDFMNLSIASRYLYIGLIMLASEGCNRVANDPPWIAQRLAISPSDIDLKPLYKSGLLIASESSVRRYTEETETEKSRDRVETETEAEVMKAAAPSVLSRLENFSITPDIEAWAAKEEISSVHAYLEEFKDYWRTVGGKRKSGQEIKDWPAAFKNRLRDLKKSGKLKTVNVWGD